MNEPALSIIVVSYNTRELTLECLRSVYEQTKRTGFELIVVDNASSDGSAEAIAAEFPQIALIESGRNLGFAGANNLGAERARGTFLLLLNPDTVVLDGAIDKLMEFAAANPGAGIWGGRTVFRDGSLNPASCWRRQTPWSVFCRGIGLSTVFKGSGLFDPEGYGGWKRDSVRRVDIVSGCFFLIGAELWRRLGGFDPAFFMYGEEADLCLRARRVGVRPMVTPEATIVHLGGASERVAEDRLVRLMAARTLLIRRHWSVAWRWFGVAMLELWAMTRGFAGRAARMAGVRRAAEAGDAWRGCWRRRAEWARAGAGAGAGVGAGVGAVRG